VDVWENENAVETRGVDECFHWSFQFSQTFRHECFISQWKLGKEACTFFHEMNFGNIFPFHSVLMVVFQRILVISDSVKLTCLYHKLVYTTQMNSAFRALWLVNSEVVSKYYSPPSSRRERFQNFRPLDTHKITFWSANYSACVVYTKAIIHLSVGESDGYLPRRFCGSVNIHHFSRPLRWIIVNYFCLDFVGVTVVKYQLSYCSQGCCSY